MNHLHHIKLCTITFLYIELFFYSLYMFIDIMSDYRLFICDIFKYLAIIISFIYTCYLYFNHKVSFSFLTCTLFVLFADYFLLFGGVHTLYGIVFFCIIQIFYFINLQPTKYLCIYLIITLMFSLNLTYGLFKWFNMNHPYIFWAVQYMTMLSTNIVLSIVKYIHKNSLKNLLFTIGLLFFFISDINVGLLNMTDIFNNMDLLWIQQFNTTALQTITTLSMWFYYLPGQVFMIFSQKIPKS